MRIALWIWLAALTFWASTLPAAEPASLVAARNEYEAALTAANKVLQRDALAARKKYVAKLAELQKTLTMRGDLEGALAVKAESETFQASDEDAFPQGKWAVRCTAFADGGGHGRRYIFRARIGELTLGETRHRLEWLPRDGMLLLRREDGSWEHWQPRADGRYFVDYFARDGANWGAGVAVPMAD